jgi:hypothetical protein
VAPANSLRQQGAGATSSEQQQTVKPLGRRPTWLSQGELNAEANQFK